MTALESLQECAAQNNIYIYKDLYFDDVSCAVNMGGTSAIVLSEDHIASEANETVYLAHELGHCMTGAFYNIFSPMCHPGRCENRANIWAIKRLVAKEKLENAICLGTTDVWELAEHFNVTESFMAKAVEYYKMTSEV